jgi:hypothetical protein
MWLAAPEYATNPPERSRKKEPTERINKEYDDQTLTDDQIIIAIQGSGYEAVANNRD